MVMKLSSTYGGTKYIPQVKCSDEQLTVFYTDKLTGLALNAELIPHFKEEITDLSDLVGMQDSDIDAIKTSLATSTKDKDGKPTPSFKLPHRTVMRIKGLATVMNYLSLVRRNLTPNEMNWTHIQQFLREWAALQELAKADPPPVPKFNVQKGMARHLIAMMEFLSKVYGSQYTTLNYLVNSKEYRDESAPEDAEPFQQGRFYTLKFPRPVDELCARAPRDTPDAQADNEKLYNFLAESLAGTPAESNTEEFSRLRDGVGLWNFIKDTQCTDVVHEQLCEKALHWIMNGKWHGVQNGQLVDWINKHRRQFSNFKESAVQAGCQIPDGRSRVDYLLNSIKSDDPAIIIRVQNVRDDATRRNNFEVAAKYLGDCRYKGMDKKRQRVQFEKEANLSDLQGHDAAGGGGDEDAASTNKKPRGLKSAAYQAALNLNGGRGKSGVELRWHSPAEYRKLPPKQRKELTQWRATQGLTAKKQREAKKKKKGNTVKDTLGKIASVLAEGVPQDKAAQIKSLVASLGADIGAVAVDPMAPPGEEDQTANTENVEADVGGSAAVQEELSNESLLDILAAAKDNESTPEGEAKVEPLDSEDKNQVKAAAAVGRQLASEIDEQVKIAAAIGLQEIVKKNAGGKKD